MAGRGRDRLLATTGAFYDAAAGGLPWAAAGAALSALVGARSAALMVCANASDAAVPELLCHPNIPPEAVEAYGRRYRHLDLWTLRATRAFAPGSGARPRVLRGGELLVPEAELLRSPFYNEFGRLHGLRHVIGTVAPLGEAGTMPLGLHRPEGAAPFGTDEVRLLEAALPHLRRALQLWHRLRPAPPSRTDAALGAAALDALPLATLVVDASLRVRLANAAALVLTGGAGAPLRLRRAAGPDPAGTVAEAGDRGDRAALAALVRATALGGGAGGGVRLRDGAGLPGLAVLVAPLPARLDGPAGRGEGRMGGAALLLLRPLAAPPAPDAGLLRDLFGLTRAEAEVARALAGGASKRSVAAVRGLRETTVRTQVRAVLDKTGAANLRALERLLAALAGP